MPCRLRTKMFDASYASTLPRREPGASWLGPSSPTSTPGRRGCMRTLVCSPSKPFEPPGRADKRLSMVVAAQRQTELANAETELRAWIARNPLPPPPASLGTQRTHLGAGMDQQKRQKCP